MAIAVLDGEEILESPWPRPRLRLVEPLAPEGDPVALVAPVLEPEEEAWNWDDVGPAPVPRSVAEPPAPAPVLGRPTPAGHRRARVLRRRRAALGVVALGLLVALAAPVSALAGKPVAAGRAAPGARVHAIVYTVRPGDSLRSIAARLSPGPHSASLASALAAQLGTERIVPGERLVLP